MGQSPDERLVRQGPLHADPQRVAHIPHLRRLFDPAQLPLRLPQPPLCLLTPLCHDLVEEVFVIADR